MNINYSEIDIEIVDIIRKLNDLGYETRYSCAGHLRKPSFYIMFLKNYHFSSCPNRCYFEEDEEKNWYVLRGGVKDESSNNYVAFSDEEYMNWKKMSDEEKKKYNDELQNSVRAWVNSLPKNI